MLRHRQPALRASVTRCAPRGPFIESLESRTLLNGAFAIQAVALSGEAAPGAPVGAVFNSFSFGTPGPAIGDDGFVAFGATMATGVAGVVDSNSSGFWVGKAGSLQLLVREGDPAPSQSETVGDITNSTMPPRIARAGNIAFGFQEAGGFDTSAYAVRGGTLQLLANSRGPSPLGGDFNGFSRPFINPGGQVFYKGFLSGPGVTSANSVALFIGGGSGSLSVRTGDPIPELPGKTYLDFYNAGGLSGAGKGVVAGRSSDGIDHIYLLSPGSAQILLDARDEIAGGTAFPFGAFFDVNINDANHVIFEAVLQGPSTNFRGLWVATGPGTTTKVAQVGDTARGTSAIYSDFWDGSAVIGGGDNIAFLANLAGEGVNGNNMRALYAGAAGSVELLARGGEAAPGMPDGVTFGNDIGYPLLNASGQVAFAAKLAGTGITSSNDEAIWATDAGGTLRLVAREGDTMVVKPGVIGTITGLKLGGDAGGGGGSGGQDGRATALNDAGQLAFAARVSMTTGPNYDGIFIADTTKAPPTSGSVGDFVWDDFDSNGRQDEGEPGVAGVTVKLFRTADSIVGNGDDQLFGSTTSGSDGSYHFATVDTGNYFLEFVAPNNLMVPTDANQGADNNKDSDAHTLGSGTPLPASRTDIFGVSAGPEDTSWDAGFIDLSDHSGPTAQVTSAPGLVVAGSEAYSFEITYSDEAGVQQSTLDDLDITVTGPLGYNSPAVLDGVNASDPKNVRVTYIIPAPLVYQDAFVELHGFLPSHNGNYDIALNNDAVTDELGNATGPSKKIGGFAVSISDTAPPEAEVITPVPGVGVVGMFPNAALGVIYLDLGLIDPTTVNANNLYLRELSSAGPGDAIDTLEFASVGQTSVSTPLSVREVVRYELNPAAITPLIKPENEGSWGVFVRANSVRDKLGNTFAQDAQIGTIPFDFMAPVVTLVDTFGPTDPAAPFGFDVTYRDAGSGVDVFSLALSTSGPGQGAIEITGPNGLPVLVNNAANAPTGPQNAFTHRYAAQPPGEGEWVEGEYTVKVRDAVIRDQAGNKISGHVIGTFRYVPAGKQTVVEADPGTPNSVAITLPGGKGITINVSKDDANFATQLIGEAIQQRTIKKGKKAVTGQINSIQKIIFGPSSKKSKVRVKGSTAPADRLGINTIHVTGPMGQFLAPSLDLLGSAQFEGTLGKLQLGNVADDHLITIGAPSDPGDTVTVILDRVKNADLVSLTPIDTLIVTEWIDDDGDPDTITAPWIGKIIVNGDSRNGVAGDFGAGLNLSGEGLAAGAPALGSLTAKGRLDGAWDITGGIKKLVAGSVSDTWEASVSGAIGTIKVAGDVAGTLSALSIGSATVGGSLTGATLTLSQAVDLALRSLGGLTVKGDVLDSEIRAAGNVGGVTVGSLLGTKLFAGVKASVDTLPDELDDFSDTAATIASVTVKGLAASPGAVAFADTLLAAGVLSKVKLLRVDTADDGDAFGLAADRIGTVTGLTLPVSNLDAPSEIVEGDLLVRSL
jgi:hypothetical protein